MGAGHGLGRYCNCIHNIQIFSSNNFVILLTFKCLFKRSFQHIEEDVMEVKYHEDQPEALVVRNHSRVLTDVLTDIFNTSPKCLKSASVIPGDNYFPPFAPALWRSFQQLVMGHITANHFAFLDPYHLAFLPTCSTEDAATLAIHTRLTGKQTIVWGCPSSASARHSTARTNPETNHGLKTSLCNWILEFLTRRPQFVRVGNITSAPISPGTSQGFCFTPLLFTRLASDSSTRTTSDHIKYADTTTMIGLVSGGDDTEWRFFDFTCSTSSWNQFPQEDE